MTKGALYSGEIDLLGALFPTEIDSPGIILYTGEIDSLGQCIYTPARLTHRGIPGGD